MGRYWLSFGARTLLCFLSEIADGAASLLFHLQLATNDASEERLVPGIQ
jgi:hypothetical protein